jgi:threonylcarbamoyladenosine tRNA methylthiotransferase MtaB
MSRTLPIATTSLEDQPVSHLVRSVYLHTLGCKLNYSETTTIGQQFLDRGYSIARSAEEADVFLLNTCSVTENAEKECRKLLRRVLRASPKMFVAVTGCYAQLRPEQIASIEGVDVVLGAKEKFDLFDHIDSFEKRTAALVLSNAIEEATDFYLATSESSIGRTRAFLKVQDGCDYNCSFCTIPEARGASRSGSIQQIVNEAIELSEKGFLEIILSGVNVGDFGRKSGSSFYELLAALEAEGRVTTRIRISSIEPNLLTDEIIELVASSSKFCRHFHVPMQSGSAKILKLMQRRYNREHYRRRVEKIKSLVPDACIGADVIVGFPGETDQDFEDTYEFIASLDVSYLHVFTYSERPGTKASTMPNSIEVHARRERNERLRILSEKKLRAFYESQVGKSVDVVLEGRSINSGDASLAINEGYSDNYLRVAFENAIAPEVTSVKARITEIDTERMTGEMTDILSTRVPHMFELPILA